MKILDRIRAHARTHGYACDICGAELFDYYPRRVCDACFHGLAHNTARVCPKCGRQTRAEGVCLVCKSHAPKFLKAFSPFVYKGKTALYVNRMKNGQRRLSFFFAERMAEYFLQACDFSEYADSALIVYVPISPAHARQRGYNQAEDLALAFAEHLEKKGISVPVCKNVLALNRVLGTQKQLRRGERVQNVRGAFHVHKRKEVKDKTVLVIDDIMTTSATGNECAETLLRAGAKAVLFLTVVSLAEG